jgi:cobalamin biosynthesis protein CobD/CbiB
MRLNRLRTTSGAVLIVLAFAGALSVGSSAADDTLVQFPGRVSWIAGATLVVSTDDGPSLAIDLSRVHQDEYQRLVTGDRVIVTGTVGRNQVLAASIESLEP